MRASPYKRICILFAIRQEMLPLARRLRLSPYQSGACRGFTGRVGSVDLFLTTSGVGRRLAAAATEAVIGTWSPDLLVMSGVAGALDPDLRVGDIVLATEVRTESEVLLPTSLFAPDEEDRTHAGALLSLDRVLVTAEEKRQASRGNGNNEPPLAVEMETAGLANVAETRGVAWAAVRAVSDTAGEGLPLDFNRLRSADGDLANSRIALAAVMRPRCVPGLIALGRNTAFAAERLAEFWAEWLETTSAGSE